VLADIAGRPMLAWQVDRIRASMLIDDVVIATSTNEGDDAIARLADEIGVAPERMDPKVKKPLSIFSFQLKTWPEFCVIKAIADFAEILQVEDLLHCSFHPLRNLGRITMPEEKFHAKFGKDFCLELIQAGQGGAVQDAIDRYFPITPAFFGASNSKNNEMFRRLGLKQRTNDEMRADFLQRVTELVEKDFGLKLPTVH